VLGGVDGPSSLVTSMSVVAKLLGNQFDASTMSHFLELDADMEVLESGHSVGLTDDEVDALWSCVHPVVDSLASRVPSSVARNHSYGMGE
jgi:hypothetical protein